MEDPSPEDNLRRSKRNKFHLDVAAIHGMPSSKKSARNSPAATTSKLSESLTVRVDSPLSEAHDSRLSTPTDGKRARRPVQYRNLALYGYSDDMLDDEQRVGMTGDHACEKCPSRWETKAGLINHYKMHTGDNKRKYACEVCDFSSGSIKAFRHHQRVHDVYGVLSAQPSPIESVVERKEEDEEDAPPLLTPEVVKGEEHEELGEAAGDDDLKEEKEPELTPNKKWKNWKKCDNCPYTTGSNSRLEKHCEGHEKSNGYLCPSADCTFKSESPSFLKRHTELHGEDQKLDWPPVYIGVKEEKTSTSSDENKATLLRTFKKDGDRFLCDVEGCTFEAFARNSLAAHKIRVHHYFNRTSNRWMCTSCGGRFKTAPLLRAHRLTRHRKPQKPLHRPVFLAELLGKDFLFYHTYPELFKKVEANTAETVALSTSSSSPAIFMSTPQTAASSTGGSFQCRHCSYSVSSQSRLEQHEKKHLFKYEFTCKFCTFSCRDQSLITKHEMRVHNLASAEAPSVEFYIENENCITELIDLPMDVLADEPTSSAAVVIPPEDLKQKATETRLGIMKKYLSKCSKPLSKSAISIKIVGEDGLKRTRCIECPYETRFLGDMRSHRAMHAMNAQFRCSQCSYSTKRNASLRQHFGSHQKFNEKYSANSVFPVTTRDNVRYGTRKGFGQRRIYLCLQCPYISSSMVLLWRHARRHMFPSKYHACSACSYSADDVEKMEEHQLVHPDGQAIIKQLTEPKKEEKDSFAEMPILGKEEPSTIEESVKPKKGKKRKAEPTEKESKKKAPSPTIATRAPSGRSTKGKRNNEFYNHEKELEKIRSSSDPVEDPKKDIMPIADAMAMARAYREKERGIEKEMVCPDCGFTDSHVEVFRQHRSMHFGTRAFACELCSFSTSMGEILAVHYNVHYRPPTEEMKKRARKQKRNAGGREKQQTVFPESVTATKIACGFCKSTVEKHLYTKHWTHHIEMMVKRNNVRMKRENGDEARKRKMDYVGRPKPSQNRAKEEASFVLCRICSFRCQLPHSMIRHREMHMQPGLYKCRVCNYQSNSKVVVQFHESHHHLATPLSKPAIEAAVAAAAAAASAATSTSTSTEEVTTAETEAVAENGPQLESTTTTDEERVKLSGTMFRCQHCSFNTHHSADLVNHLERNHATTTEQEKEDLEMIRMGLFPVASIVSI